MNKETKGALPVKGKVEILSAIRMPGKYNLTLTGGEKAK
jgi:hypothetical protein